MSIVGYTNAGKTSLFNLLTKGGLDAEDKLFATLDTTTRRSNFKFQTLETVLFSDTVGFISNLPTKLVESFKATLDDLASADLLIHVIDAADTNRDYKIKEVDLILDDLGVTSMPQIRALNKIDLIANEDIWPANNLHPEIKISSETGEGLDELKNIISEMLFGGLLCGWVHFPPVQASIRSKLFDSGCILEEKMGSNGQHQSLVSISRSMLEQFEEIGEVIGAHRGPLVMAGDFNTWSEERQAWLDTFADLHQLHAVEFDPDRRTTIFSRPIDHIYTRGLDTVNAQAVPVGSSDHNPLLIRVQIDAN